MSHVHRSTGEIASLLVDEIAGAMRVAADTDDYRYIEDHVTAAIEQRSDSSSRRTAIVSLLNIGGFARDDVRAAESILDLYL